MSYPLVLCVDSESYIAAVAALALAGQDTSSGLSAKFLSAKDDLEEAMRRSVNASAATLPALLRRQAE